MRHPVVPMLLLAAALLVVSPASAFAHTPVLEQSGRSDAPWAAPTGYGPARLFPGAQDVVDPIVSRAVYGTLVTGESFDAYRFVTSADATVSIPVELLVPDTAANAAFRPTLVVIGAGDPAAVASLPSAVRDHLMAIESTVPVTVAVDPGTDPRAGEYEPFVGEVLLKGASTRVDIGRRGTYYVIVYDPSGAFGEYRLVLGEAEAFTAGEVLRTPVDVVRIRLGLYGQSGFKWGFAAILAAVLAILAGAALLLVARSRRGRTQMRSTRVRTR
ncbi:MAG: hypothetical protein Q7W16_06625 [Coriobacteriia bacterium]|nr:hypothetical protein [Coriobacteriia bacterium]